MIKISDSKSIFSDIYLEDLYISDKSKQELHFSISKEIPNILISKNNSLFNKVFGLALTRFSLQRNQLLIPYLLTEKLNDFLKADNCKLILSKKNKGLGEYLKGYSNDPEKVTIEYHNKINFWKNGLTKITLLKKIKVLLLTSLSLIYVFFLILVFRFRKKKYSKIEWMSFANNKESIDYVIIDKIKAMNISLSFPGLIPFQNKYSRLIFSSRSYSITSFLNFGKDLLNFIFFNELKINGFDEKYPKIFIISFNSVLQLIYQYLISFCLNNISNIQIFRGGNSNGIWASSLNPKIKTILLPHGTEIYPLDHAIYMFVDYYILPSDTIVYKWLNHKNNLRLGNLIPLGRPFYETLRTSVNSEPKIDNSMKVIGIVLTYSSDERTRSFISEIYDSFNKFPNITFLIKERTNFKNDLSFVKNLSNISIHKGDIFSFLSITDLVVAGISDLSVLGMTVLDAISLDIPSIYFTQKRSKSDLGYSYCEEMSDFTFEDIKLINNLISGYSILNELLDEIKIRNKTTKILLGPNKGVMDKFVDFVNKLSDDK
tara:strand:+ start:8403 stop:10034 length:1632 start_codon:yes stop_codon:yes gene_type:complete